MKTTISSRSTQSFTLKYTYLKYTLDPTSPKDHGPVKYSISPVTSLSAVEEIVRDSTYVYRDRRLFRSVAPCPLLGSFVPDSCDRQSHRRIASNEHVVPSRSIATRINNIVRSEDARGRATGDASVLMFAGHANK